MANEFNDDGPSWESDYTFTGTNWAYKHYDGNQEDCGNCKTEQDAMDEAYEHWLEQRG